MVFLLHYVLFPTPLTQYMPEPPLTLPKQVLEDVEAHVSETISNGTHIRNVLAKHSSTGPWNTEWEVEECLKGEPQ